MNWKNILRYWCLTIAALLVVILFQPVVFGQRDAMNPLAPPPVGSPQETMMSFLRDTTLVHNLITTTIEAGQKEGGLFYSEELWAKGHEADDAMERAIATLDLSAVPPAQQDDVSVETVLMLKEVLDRIQLPSQYKIPGINEVNNESLTSWKIPKTDIAIGLVESGPDEGQFLFTPETVANIRKYYEEVKDLPYNPGATENFYISYISTPGSILPPKWAVRIPPFLNHLYYDQTIWQWLSFVFVYSGTFVLLLLLYKLVQRYTAKWQSNHVLSAWLGLWLPSVAFVSISVIDNLIDNFINLTGRLLLTLKVADTIIIFMIGAWTAFLFFNALGVSIINTPRFKAKPLASVMLRNGFLLLGILAGAVIVTIGCQTLGISVTPLLASLGAGSLALSFGLRPYVEDVVGGITLFVNGTMKIGDYCEFGGVEGTVEDISLRATILRTKDRKLITVPNSGVSSTLVNHSRRDKFIFEKVVSLAEDFPLAELPVLMGSLRKSLIDHPLIDESRVSLMSLGQGNVSLNLFGYVETRDADRFEEIQGDLLIIIADELAKMGLEGNVLTVDQDD